MVDSFPCLAPALPGHGPGLPQSMAGHRGSCAVLGTGASGDKAAGAGLGSGTGGNILPELSAVAAANPSAQGNGSASCCSLCQHQRRAKQQLLSGQSQQNPVRFPRAMGLGWLVGWGWGARQPLACCGHCQSRRQSATGLGSSPMCLGWGFGCAEPEPHLVAPSQPCCGSQGCSCCQLWLSPKC